MKVNLTEKQIEHLKSMNIYWEEVSKRDDPKEIPFAELNGVIRIIEPMDVLLILGEYAKNYNVKATTPDIRMRESLKNLQVLLEYNGNYNDGGFQKDREALDIIKYALSFPQ